MTDLPQYALSVRQPWAWAIVYADKDIENRLWKRPNPGLSFRGRVCIHASKTMTQAEYHDANELIGVVSKEYAHSPMPYDLYFGAIIGTVDIVDVVKTSDSSWFMGPSPGLIGLVLANPMSIPPIRVHGALGFFNWRDRLNHSDFPEVFPKWMQMKPDAEMQQSEPMGTLL